MGILCHAKRACADDIGLVIRHMARLIAVRTEFQTFASISGLHLNLPKTMLVPLWDSTIKTVSRMIAHDYPCLSAMQVPYKAKYLGIWMGP